MNDKSNQKPLVSIIVPTFNTISVIENVASNFSGIKYSPIEIIFSDDCSTDGSYEKLLDLAKKDSRLKIIQNAQNSGPSKTRNNGLKVAKGKYIALLETDMEADPNYIDYLIERIDSDESLGAVQSLVLDINKKDIIQADVMHYDPHSFFVCIENIGMNKKDVPDLNEEKFSTVGAVGSLIRKNVLDKIGGFDEMIVHNIDDIDLGWRIWISGKKIVTVPKAVTYHWTFKQLELREKVTKKVTSEFHFHKTLRIFIKNYELHNLLWYTPWLYFTFISRVILNLFRGNTAPLKGLLLSTGWLIKNFPDNLDERKRVQALRGFSDKIIFNHIFEKGNFFQIYKKIQDNVERCRKVFR